MDPSVTNSKQTENVTKSTFDYSSFDQSSSNSSLYQNGRQSSNQSIYYDSSWDFKLLNNHENDPLYFRRIDSNMARQIPNNCSDYQTDVSTGFVILPNSSIDYAQRAATNPNLAYQPPPPGYALPMNNNLVYPNGPQPNNHVFYANGTGEYLTNNYEFNKGTHFRIHDQSLVEINGQHYLKVIQENLIPIHNHRYYPMLEPFLNENKNDNGKGSKYKNSSTQSNSTKLVENVSLNNFLVDGSLFGSCISNSNDDDFGNEFFEFNYENYENPMKNQKEANKISGNTTGASNGSLADGLDSSKTIKKQTKKPLSQAKPKNFHCSKCNRSFVTADALTSHEKVHSANKPFKCDQCENTYATKATLNRHKLLHDPSRRSTCEFCGKKFPTATQLSVHLRKHTGEKPYKCNICNKSFTQSNTLKRHTKNHERDENEPSTKKIKIERGQSLDGSNSNSELSSLGNYGKDKDSSSNNSLFSNILNDPSLNNNLQQPN